MTKLARLYTRILVPLDGSNAAEFAIRFALDLAGKHQAELVLLHLRYSDVLNVEDDGESTSNADSETGVARYLDYLRKGYPTEEIAVQVNTITSRNLRETLFSVIDTERVSAVVLSTQGRTNMLRWLFGSSLETALANFPVPLMLVRPMYQQIVVPLDGSKWSESAIPRAVELARVHDAELVLLHVHQPKGGSYAADWALAGQQKIADQSYEQMHEQMISLRNRLRQEGLRAREVMLRGNNPPQIICEFLESEDGISLVVMSTHGRTGLSRWLMGSVAQYVIKNSRSPVTLVNPEQR